MKNILFPAFLIFAATHISSQTGSQFITHFEKSNFTETPRYDSVIRFCSELSNHSPMIHYTSFGTSAQQRDLPLLILDKDGYSSPDEIKQTGRLILLIEAGIHPGEPDGIDAGLMLFRDIAIYKKHLELLEQVSILFIPIFNVDGHARFGPYNRINQNGPKEMGWRTNANNLNLNRDFVKAESPAMQAWLKLFHYWMPDFFIDCHTTDGADYQYVLTYEADGNYHPLVNDWMKENYLSVLEQKMEKEGYLIFPYVWFRRWHDPRSGLIDEIPPPRLAHGYVSILNRPSVLIETHMLKDYKSRVFSTYELIVQTLKIINKHNISLKTSIEMADEAVSGENFRNTPFQINFEASKKDSTLVAYKGYEYKIDTSDLTGGLWFQYSAKPTTYQLPYFNIQVPVDSVYPPEAYIIPLEWQDIITKLSQHGIKYTTLDKPVELSTSTYRFSDVEFRKAPYEGRQTIATIIIQEIAECREFLPGSVIIDMNQSRSKLILSMLEPVSEDSYLRWGYFNAIFEQKEYAETYVMEEMARKMLNESAAIKAEFEQWKMDNPKAQKNQWEQLNWFYQHTPYWDNRKNIYPIGKIYDGELVRALIPK